MWALFRPRLATQRWRALPDALIIGAQRCGTSSLFKYLGRHPDVTPSYRKEVGYFSVGYHLGPPWYRAHFPLELYRRARVGSPPRLSFEATPDYLLDPRAPERAAQLVPHARIIILLRDPVERALSQYDHNRRLGLESLPVEQALERERERLAGAMQELLRRPEGPLPVDFRRCSYVARGMYAAQIQRWFEHFPRERVLVVRSEDFYSDTGRSFQEITSFLGLREWQPWDFRNYSYIGRSETRPATAQEDRSEVRAALRERFVEPNQELEELLGRTFAW
jgi:hypothetical protein